MAGLFGIGSGNDSSASPSPPHTVAEVKEMVKNEIAMQNFQELIQRINVKCFNKCVISPGTHLSGGETVRLRRERSIL